MKLTILYGDCELDIERIQVIESKEINFRFIESKTKSNIKNYMIIELETGDIKLEIKKQFYQINGFYSVKRVMQEKILSDKDIKLIVANDCGENTLAEII